MRFSLLHKLVSYLMIASAAAALLLSPEISLLATSLSLAGIGLSWLAEPTRLPLARATAVWNIVTLLFFIFLVTEVVQGEPVIIAGSHFLLFVLVNKLFNRHTSKDYLQAYVLSFLLLVAATTLNTGISYALCFALYCLFATWALSLLHLRREMEENYLLKHSEGAQSEKVEVARILGSRRIVGGSFLAGTSLLALGVLLGAGLVFLLFPRIGFGLFVAQKRGGVALAGFRERVELGHHGVVHDNPNVVMRVVPQGPLPGPLRWRGSAFDHYQRGVWSHGPELMGRTQALIPRGGLYLVNHAPGLPPRPAPETVRRQLFRQEIYLEPMDAAVVFAADRPVAIEGATFVPRRGPLGEIHSAKPRTTGVRYLAYSHLTSPPAALLRQAAPIHDPRRDHFLQLPRELPGRIGVLARRIARGRETTYDQVIAVQAHLRANYAYTLQLEHDPAREPLDEFLFVTRRGHCEYFATAMTILLRHLGIHARSVNGFAGGEWNRFGNYLAIRQGDAHTWVEVLFSNVGWVTFDPTPQRSRPVAPSAGVTARVRQLLDAWRLRWFRYVVEYDLRQQVSLAREVHRTLRSSVGRGLSGRWRPLALGAGLAVLLTAALLLWRKRSRRARHGGGTRSRLALPPAARLYRALLGHLARLNHPKPPGVTPGEFAAVLRERGFSAAELVDRFTRCYYEARYGGADRQEELRGLLGQIARAGRR